jgi:IPT/TIG domain-containing protein
MRRFKLIAVAMTLGASLVTASVAGVAMAHGSTAPSISLAKPDVGPLGGGTNVLIKGKNLEDVANGDVYFGSTEATDVIPHSPGEFHAIAPAGSAGAVTISVTINGQTATLDNGFTYEDLPTIQHVTPDRGPSAGGNRVQIDGAGFTDATAVSFGTVAVPATNFQVDSDQAITAIVPAEPSKTTVEVTVTTPIGPSPADENEANDYTFVSGLPEVTSVSPDFGLTTGGQSVTITGYGFIDHGVPASAVDFGLVGAETFTVVNNNTIDATAPAGTGTVDVTVTTNAGISSADPPVDSFYYLSSYSS